MTIQRWKKVETINNVCVATMGCSDGMAVIFADHERETAKRDDLLGEYLRAHANAMGLCAHSCDLCKRTEALLEGK